MRQSTRLIVVILVAISAGTVSIVCVGRLRTRLSPTPVFFSSPGLILASATVGDVEGWYLLDTGCAMTSVAPRVALSLESTGRSIEVSSSLSANEPIRATAFLSGGVRFAGGRLRYPERVDVMDHDRLSVLLAHDMDGTLGWDVLRNYVIGIDSRQRRLLASRKTSAAEMLKKFDLERPDVRVALETLDQSPFLTATCEDHSLKLMLDTGATMTTLFAKSWNRVSIEYANPPPPQGMAWGVTGESPVQGGRLRELSVGPLRLLDVPVAVTGVEAAAARRGSSSVPFDGVLGMNVLSRFLVVIDGPEGVLYLAEYASTAE